jgi:hypothetical protein
MFGTEPFRLPSVVFFRARSNGNPLIFIAILLIFSSNMRKAA